MAEVLEVVRAHRARLLSREAIVTRRMLRQWSALRDLVEREQRALAERMLRELRMGGVIRASWLHTYGRLDELGQQIAGEVDRFAAAARPLAAELAADAAELGVRSSVTAASAAGIPQGEIIAATLQTRPVERVVAVTQRGAPVARVLADMAPNAAEMLRDELLRGAVMGENPEKIASRMRRVAEVPLARARTVARTEAMRAFRGAQVERWAEIPSVTGWVWLSAADGRTCAACLAMHGTVHPDGAELESHPNCRCVPAPVVSGQTIIPKPGAQLMRELPPEQLERRLGRARARALRGGRIIPADLVAVRESPVWGRTRTVASLRTALRNAERRRAATL